MRWFCYTSEYPLFLPVQYFYFMPQGLTHMWSAMLYFIASHLIFDATLYALLQQQGIEYAQFLVMFPYMLPITPQRFLRRVKLRLNILLILYGGLISWNFSPVIPWRKEGSLGEVLWSSHLTLLLLPAEADLMVSTAALIGRQDRFKAPNAPVRIVPRY